MPDDAPLRKGRDSGIAPFLESIPSFRLSAVSDDAVISAITAEGQMRGWLAEIHRSTNPVQQIAAYDRLVRQVELSALWVILPWDLAAVECFRRLRDQLIRIGTQDLKIASIVLAHDATLLTRNTGDFAKMQGLKFKNWLD